MWSGALLQFGWMMRKVSGFGHTSAAWREQGWGWWSFFPNAMMIGWVGPAHAVSLHALTAKHNKTATMATSQGNSKVVSSNWKYRHYFSLILIKGKKVCVTCSYAQEKRLYPHLPQATRILWSSSHQHMLTRQAAICWIQLNTKCSKILWIVFLFFNQLI